MGRRLVPGLARAAFAVLFTTIWVTGASAQVIKINACQTLATPGAAYRLTADLLACGDCLVVAANRVTIELDGFMIVQDIGCFAGAGITDGGVAREQITVKNGAAFSDDLGSFDYGIDLRASIRTEVRTFDTTFNNFDGIAVGNRALVKDCLSFANGDNGISGGDMVQVEASGAFLNGLAGGADLAGIRVGDHCLVTGNDASVNALSGIVAGAFCTLTHNSATSNDERGIAVVGAGGLVSHNTTDDNTDAGLEVRCPGTVTNNNSSGNGQDYLFVGPGCFTKNNN